MWKLNSIEAHNICAFRELNYTVRQGVTTLIFGDNRDNESQRSNGSGKSALIECIALGITGSPLRKIRTDEIINDNADECSVSLEFYNESADEVMTIRRVVSRKGSSTVECRLERDGREVMTDEAIQPSVDAYNRYILEKLGITRDELLNNFILSKHRYQDFLSSPDKEKKEIINRFSNGVLVDQAIERLQQDIAPVEASLREVDLELADIDGRIGILTEQIAQEEQSREEKSRTKAERIAAIQDSIAEKRTVIRDRNSAIEKIVEVSKTIVAVEKAALELENSGKALEECLPALETLLVPLVAEKLPDWNAQVAKKKQEIATAENEIHKFETVTGQTQAKIGVATAAHLALQSEHRVFEEQSGEKDEEYGAELAALKERLASANEEVLELRRRKRNLFAAVERLQNQLAGTVTCPACQHEFLVSDKGFDAVSARQELDCVKEGLKCVEDEILDGELDIEKAEQIRTHFLGEVRSLAASRDEWKDRLAKAVRNVQAAEYELEGYQFNLQHLKGYIAARQTEINDIRTKVFDECFGLIDEFTQRDEGRICKLTEEIAAAESSIATLEETIAEINATTGSELISSLRDSLKTYRRKSGETAAKKTGIETELSRLREQEERFVLFRGYLANTKIDALNKVTNDFLEGIGSDIRVRMSGYTVLKTGKVREKISVSLQRDGVDIGSFGKCSAGEAARVNTASILAMQALINANCENDKGLNLLVLDEIVEAVDEEGIACMFSALNRLGVTALVVSHGQTSEAYPYKLLICKENGVSRIA